jgi:hypothetical protein
VAASNRAAVVVIASLLLGGCGGSSGGHTASTTASTSTNAASTSPGSGFVPSAEAICRSLNVRLAGDNVNAIADIARIAPRRSQLEKATLAELERLQPPSSVARAWTSMLTARRSIADALAKLGSAVKTGDLKQLQPILSSSGRVALRMDATAKHAGFTDCATVG